MTGKKKAPVFTSAGVDTKNISRRLIHVKRRVFEILFHIVLAVMAAFAVASWVVPAAFAERGYSAVGGEWLLVILTFVAVIYFTEVRETDG